MFATDFEYDGKYLGDYGFIICNFEQVSGVEVINTGSKVSFAKVPYHGGSKHSLVDTTYDECLQATFDICKSPDHFDDMEISNDEYRAILRWLNRKRFFKFQLIDKFYEKNDCYFMASFNAEKILVTGKLVGIRLTMETDKPFGYGEDYTAKLKYTSPGQRKIVLNISDEIGHLYPEVTITCKQDGDLELINETEGCRTVILGCTTGEMIVLNGATNIIESSLESHDIANDFNYEFLVLGNSVDGMDNVISTSLPCDVTVAYAPIVKDAF